MAIPVKLPVFEGPLDLLLHLIEKNKIDIYDIPIAGITDQYLEYVRQMDHEDLDVTSEFLVMAATLLDIKSRMLLPREKDDETGEEEGDPREELVRRLLEYKMYKYLSEELAAYREQAGVRYFRAQKLPREVLNYRPPINYDELLGDTDLQSLQKIFGEVLRRKKSRRDPIRGGFGKIRREEISLDNKTLYIRAYLQAHPRTDFRALLESRESREEVIVTFLIILELMKTQKVHIVQDSIGGAILIEAGAPENAGAGPDDAPVDIEEETRDENEDSPTLMDTGEDSAEEHEDTPADTEEDSSEEPVVNPVDTEEDSSEEHEDTTFADTEEDSAVEPVGDPADTEEGANEPVDCSLGSFENIGSAPSELQRDSSELSADRLVSPEASPPAADIRNDSAAASCTGTEVSPVDMPLTAFHRMELVTPVFTPEGLLPGSGHEDNSQTGAPAPASESRSPAIDDTETVFTEDSSSENNLSDNLVPVNETRDSSVSESELSEGIVLVDDMWNISVSESKPSENIVSADETQDSSVSESNQPVPSIAESTLSNDADAGQVQSDSSEKADFRSVREHFSAHLWCKDPCCRTRYFRAFSGKADTGKIQPPRQWTRARMTRLWARRFF